jgi:hypothetical protein
MKDQASSSYTAETMVHWQRVNNNNNNKASSGYYSSTSTQLLLQSAASYQRGAGSTKSLVSSSTTSSPSSSCRSMSSTGSSVAFIAHDIGEIKLYNPKDAPSKQPLVVVRRAVQKDDDDAAATAVQAAAAAAAAVARRGGRGNNNKTTKQPLLPPRPEAPLHELDEYLTLRPVAIVHIQSAVRGMIQRRKYRQQATLRKKNHRVFSITETLDVTASCSPKKSSLRPSPRYSTSGIIVRASSNNNNNNSNSNSSSNNNNNGNKSRSIRSMASAMFNLCDACLEPEDDCTCMGSSSSSLLDGGDYEDDYTADVLSSSSPSASSPSFSIRCSNNGPRGAGGGGLDDNNDNLSTVTRHVSSYAVDQHDIEKNDNGDVKRIMKNKDERSSLCDDASFASLASNDNAEELFGDFCEYSNVNDDDDDDEDDHDHVFNFKVQRGKLLLVHDDSMSHGGNNDDDDDISIDLNDVVKVVANKQTPRRRGGGGAAATDLVDSLTESLTEEESSCNDFNMRSCREFNTSMSSKSSSKPVVAVPKQDEDKASPSPRRCRPSKATPTIKTTTPPPSTKSDEKLYLPAVPIQKQPQRQQPQRQQPQRQQPPPPPPSRASRHGRKQQTKMPVAVPKPKQQQKPSRTSNAGGCRTKQVEQIKLGTGIVGASSSSSSSMSLTAQMSRFKFGSIAK